MTTFDSLGLAENILKAVKAAGYEKPSPIQEQAIPVVLSGSDVFGCAQTGTGKTAAFVLPLIQKIESSGSYPGPRRFRALILTPTRELAEQISDNVAAYSKFSEVLHVKVYGGVSQLPQKKALKDGVDILIATPGRLLDLYNQKVLDFGGVEFFVLDEADRMLDMGFIPDIRKICARLPKERQTLLFSATLSAEIQELALDIVRNPKKITVSPDKPTVEKIAQSLCFVESATEKQKLLEHMMRERLARDSSALALVFTRTKHGANKVAKKLAQAGFEVGVIHGNKSQSARRTALDRFKNRDSHILVATDIAARGIDVKDMSLVVNFDLPEEAETYVHRIGRTARAEAEGEAVSFCSANELVLLRDILRFIRQDIPVNEKNPFHSDAVEDVWKSKNLPRPPKRRGNNGNRNSGGGRNSRGDRNGRGGRNSGGRGNARGAVKSASEKSESGKNFRGERSASRGENSRSGGNFDGRRKNSKASSAKKSVGFWKSLTSRIRPNS